jgi:hypothetical protein
MYLKVFISRQLVFMIKHQLPSLCIMFWLALRTPLQKHYIYRLIFKVFLKKIYILTQLSYNRYNLFSQTTVILQVSTFIEAVTENGLNKAIYKTIL